MNAKIVFGLVAGLSTFGIATLGSAQDYGHGQGSYGGGHYYERHTVTTYDLHYGDYVDRHRGLYMENHGGFSDLHYGTHSERHYGNFWMPHTYSYVEQHHVSQPRGRAPHGHHGHHGW